MAVVEIKELTKDYEIGFLRKRKVRALDSLTLSVQEGEIFGFLGANGAGKTTTLKLLMRLIFPSSGSAQILGRDIATVAMHANIGYLPENPYFYDYLTAREFLEYAGQLFGYAKSVRQERARELLSRVHLDEKRWNTQMRKFSKGMLQRVGLAQSLVNDPQIVFLDEPMSGLDPVGRRQIRDLIASLKHEGKTVFMCSHILSDIEVLCDRVAILKRGRLSQSGTLDDLRRSDATRNKMEILTSGADVGIVRAQLSGSDITTTSRGLRVVISDESELEDAVRVLRKAGGKIVSIQQMTQSLEELFMDDPK